MATEPLTETAHPPVSGPFLPRVELVALDAIHLPNNRLRARGEVGALRESIASNGLLQPVVLDAGMTLVCGWDRVEACRALGWAEIPAVIHDGWTPAEARLAEIDENLCRRELAVLERAEHIAQRHRVWNEVRAAREAALPANDGKGRGAKGRRKETGRRAELESLAVFVDDTSRRTGRGKTAVREDIRIGELPEDVRELARDSPLRDNRRELLALTRMPADEQREAIERVRSGTSKSVRKKVVKLADPADGGDGEGGGPGGLALDWTPAGEGKPGDDGVSFVEGAAPLKRSTDSLWMALEDARKALEKALALWPDVEPEKEESDPPGSDVLREAALAVRRLADSVYRDR